MAEKQWFLQRSVTTTTARKLKEYDKDRPANGVHNLEVSPKLLPWTLGRKWEQLGLTVQKLELKKADRNGNILTVYQVSVLKALRITCIFHI